MNKHRHTSFSMVVSTLFTVLFLATTSAQTVERKDWQLELSSEIGEIDGSFRPVTAREFQALLTNNPLLITHSNPEGDTLLHYLVSQGLVTHTRLVLQKLYKENPLFINKRRHIPDNKSPLELCLFLLYENKDKNLSNKLKNIVFLLRGKAADPRPANEEDAYYPHSTLVLAIKNNLPDVVSYLLEWRGPNGERISNENISFALGQLQTLPISFANNKLKTFLENALYKEDSAADSFSTPQRRSERIRRRNEASSASSTCASSAQQESYAHSTAVHEAAAAAPIREKRSRLVETDTPQEQRRRVRRRLSTESPGIIPHSSHTDSAQSEGGN